MSFDKVTSTTLQVKPLELLVKKKSNEKQIGVEAGLDGVVGVNLQVNCCQIFPLSSKIYIGGWVREGGGAMEGNVAHSGRPRS